MSGGTEKRHRRNGYWVAVVGLGVSLAVLFGSIVTVAVNAASRDTRQDVKIEHNTKGIQKLETVPADVAGIKATLDAQQTTLSQMHETIQAWAKNK